MRKRNFSKATLLAANFLKVSSQLGFFLMSTSVLSPYTFGIYALILVAYNLAEFFRDFGLSTYTITSLKNGKHDFTNLMSASLAKGVVASSVFFTLGNVFFPEYVAIIALLATSVFLSSIVYPIEALLIARSREVTAGITSAVASGISFLAGSVALYSGSGMSSLPIQALAYLGTLIILRAQLLANYQHSSLSAARLISVLKGSYHIGQGQTLDFVNGNLDNLLVGTFSSKSSLGYYSRAFQAQSLIVQATFTPLTSIALNELSGSDDPSRRYEDLRRWQLRIRIASNALFLFLLISFPLLVEEFLGSNWKGVIPYFAVLATAALFQSLSYPGYWYMVTLPSIASYKRFGILTGLAQTVLMLALAPFGAFSVSIAVLLGRMMKWFYTHWVFSKSHSPSAKSEWIRDAITVAVMAFAYILACLTTSAITSAIAPAEVGFSELAVGLVWALIFAVSSFKLDSLIRRR